MAGLGVVTGAQWSLLAVWVFCIWCMECALYLYLVSSYPVDDFTLLLASISLSTGVKIREFAQGDLSGRKTGYIQLT